MSNNLNKAYLVLEESTGNAKGNTLQRFSVTQLNTATNVGSFHFACIRGHLLCFSIDSGQIFLNKSFRKSLSLQSRPYAGDSWHPPCMAKSISRTSRCLASHTCEFADHVSTP